MKHIILISILFLFNINAFSQKDSADCITEATIIAYDYTRFACCTGWIIIIDNQNYLSKSDIPGWKKPEAFTQTFVIDNKV